jgi:diaminopropionate ammonia-lyase
MTAEAGARFFFQKTERNFEWTAAATATDAPLDFHRRLPAYAPTPLIDVPELARLLGIGQVLVKDESNRFGLPAFKILGASWAVYRALESSGAGNFEPWRTLDELVPKLAPLRPLTLATATDGNHGRAVAHVAALFGLGARIFVPAGTARPRIEGIAREGAHVEAVEGTYDDAVERAAREAGERCLVISDTSWPGYEAIPHCVMEGYSTIFREIDAQLGRRGEEVPDLFPIPFGVGALAAAVVRPYPAGRPKLLAVEPLRAACALAAMEAGEIVSVPGPHDSIMAGLNCGRVSRIAWPIISRGIDAFLAIPDERAREALRALARVGFVAGETGAAGLAGLIELLDGDSRNRAALDLNEKTRVLILVTEGATDPVSYERIVGSDPTSRAEL